MKKSTLLTALLTVTCVSCAGGDISSSLQKPAPDEFTVVPYQPLSVPPNFDLKNPNSTPTSSVPSKQANTKMGKEDSQFLEALGAKKSGNTHVKQEIDDEYNKQQSEMKNKGSITKTVAKLNNIGQNKYVDPKAEKERIEENISEGKPLNEGEVPTRQVGSTLERIFN